MEMPDTATLVNDYIAMWNEADAERRRALVARTLTDDATYVDPLMAGAGTDQISAMIGAAQQQYPGHRFALHTAPDAHNDRVRFGWSLSPNGGDPIAIGVDFATVAPDGRMQSVTGFLEPAA
jgi:hypothetical protein